DEDILLFVPKFQHVI
ncbi:hypothetical protein D050_4881B, partial [Vibrio parahaemolyticus VPCR-2009]